MKALTEQALRKRSELGAGDLRTHGPKHGTCRGPALSIFSGSRNCREVLATGHHFWNAGMFLFQVDHMVGLFENHQPELWGRISKVKPDLSDVKLTYANLESISLDYAIMEKEKSQVCIPCDIGWSDVGSWDELARLGEEVPNLKRSGGAQVFNVDARNNYVFSIHNKVIGLVGLENKIVVDTPDALLISEKGRSQDVKELLGVLKEAGLPEVTEHPFETRPWGRYEVIVDRKDYKSKVITVNAGHQLSYQSHKHRVENRTVVAGQGEVVLDGVTHPLAIGIRLRFHKGPSTVCATPAQSHLSLPRRKREPILVRTTSKDTRTIMGVDLKDYLSESTEPAVMDGSMSTSLYNKGFYINRSFEELSVTAESAVREVTQSFKKAGSKILRTNTFGATVPKLAEYNIQDRLVR